jgi:phage repressor protein C with HTH and peptisase S24 domain/predicted transcriptional regulator
MTKKKELSPELRAECEAAKALFISKKNSLGLTQAKLAESAEISPAAVAMYLNGTNPLNAKFAAVLARLIEEPVERFSPRLAKEISQMAGPIAVESKSESTGLAVSEQGGTYGAAAKVMEMLSKHGKNLTDSAQQRLLQAVSDTLTEVKAGNVIPGNFSRAARVQDGDILIPQYDVRASMGHGQVPADYVEFVRNVVVNGLQLEKLGLEYTSPANLSIITGWGQSMAGTIDDKDPVIVDRGITEFNGDGVYVLTWDGMLYIKRLQKADADHFDMISDNEKHKDRVVPVGDVTIHARVLYVWKGQKL